MTVMIYDRIFHFQVQEYTGLKDSAAFKALLKFLRTHTNPAALTYAVTESHVCHLSYEDQLFLTLKKFRLGLSDGILAADFFHFTDF